MTSVGTVISFPIPPYANVPIDSQFYSPSEFVISGINLGSTTTITTTLDVNFSVGQLVRLVIPPAFGSYQLNGRTGYVLSIPATNQVVLSLDSSQNVDSFISATYNTQQPQIVPIGDINNGQTNSSGRSNTITFIAGSFTNIS